MAVQSSSLRMLPSKDGHAARGPEFKSARGEGILLMSSAMAGSSGGAGCCWERPGQVSFMVSQSSAPELLPNKDRHTARSPGAQSSSQLLVRVVCWRRVPWQALLEGQAAAGSAQVR